MYIHVYIQTVQNIMQRSNVSSLWSNYEETATLPVIHNMKINYFKNAVYNYWSSYRCWESILIAGRDISIMKNLPSKYICKSNIIEKCENTYEEIINFPMCGNYRTGWICKTNIFTINWKMRPLALWLIMHQWHYTLWNVFCLQRCT